MKVLITGISGALGRMVDLVFIGRVGSNAPIERPVLSVALAEPLRDLPLQILLEAAAVREPGQRITVGQIEQRARIFGITYSKGGRCRFELKTTSP